LFGYLSIDEGFRLIEYGVDMIFLEKAIREAFSHAIKYERNLV